MSAASEYLESEAVYTKLMQCAENLVQKKSSYSSTQSFPISVISRKPSQIVWFFCGRDGNVYTSWWTEGQQSPDGWKSLGGEFQAGSKVTAVAQRRDQIDVFVFHSGRVYTSWWNKHSDWSSLGGFFFVFKNIPFGERFAQMVYPPTCPSGWQSIGGTCPRASDVVAVARKATHLDLFMCGSDENVRTPLFPPGANVSAVGRKSTDLDLFVCGKDEQVYTSHYDEGSNMWSDWSIIRGSHQTPQFPVGANVSAVHRTASELDVFVCGQDGQVYTSHWDEELTTWLDWSIVGDNQQISRFPSGAKISAVSQPAHKVHLFICSANGRVYHSRKENKWRKWEIVGDRQFPGATEVAAVHWRDNHLELFICDCNGVIWRRDFYYGNDWQEMSGH
ncbi:hypothetical protein BDV59DRAFT_162959 [Aspergillus ambiguus]|uniref:uncharacterized protein n=1 Tax=Aspergillus ambiguus TaxID=176160 RepID=UPI003CCD846A